MATQSKSKTKQSKPKSKTQLKRAAYNYRAEYFKRNPGLFGCIWFCSQCHKMLIGRKNVQVDHIWALGAGGINRTINTVAICATCNKKKSDKLGVYLVKGEISKVIEVIMFGIQKIIVSIFKILAEPFKDSSITTKLLAIGVYALLFYLFFLRR